MFIESFDKYLVYMSYNIKNRVNQKHIYTTSKYMSNGPKIEVL